MDWVSFLVFFLILKIDAQICKRFSKYSNSNTEMYIYKN